MVGAGGEGEEGMKVGLCVKDAFFRSQLIVHLIATRLR